MIAEAGLAALWFAAALALLQLVLAAIGVRATRVAVADGARGSGTPAFAGEQGAAAGILAAVRPVAVVQGALAVLAMGLLIALFLRSDMSVLLVAQNSHTAKPWLYKFAGERKSTRLNSSHSCASRMPSS